MANKIIKHYGREVFVPIGVRPHIQNSSTRYSKAVRPSKGDLRRGKYALSEVDYEVAVRLAKLKKDHPENG